MNDRLHVAAMLLSQLITADQGRDLRACLPAVRHSIDLADLLIGECETSVAGGSQQLAEFFSVPDDYSGPELTTDSPTVPSLPGQIYMRRRSLLPQLKPTRPPTLH